MTTHYCLLTHTWYVKKRTHIHIYTEALWMSLRKELAARLLLFRDCHRYRALRVTCAAEAQQQGWKKAETYWYEFLRARRNEAGGSMGLALWVFPGATTSQVRGAKPLEN